MRRQNLFWPLPACALLLASCAGTTNLHIREKPDIALPAQARKIAVVDRCSFYTDMKRSRWTGKTKPNGLKYNYGVLDCIQTFAASWQDAGLADSVFVPYGIELKGMEKAGEVPKRMSAEEAQRLCKRFNTDALLVLESYTANFTVSYIPSSVVHSPGTSGPYGGPWGPNDVEPRLVPDPRVDAPSPAPPVVEEYRRPPNTYTMPSRPNTGNFNIYSVWRLYDATGEQVLSELHLSNFMSIGLYESNGEYWPNERQMREQVGSAVGWSSAQHVESQWKAVSRTYFASGARAIRKGAKQAKESNWQAAASYWRPIAEKNRRGSARACYNMAVAAEKQGSILLAQEWAKKAEEKGCRIAADYRAELERVVEVRK